MFAHNNNVIIIKPRELNALAYIGNVVWLDSHTWLYLWQRTKFKLSFIEPLQLNVTW